MFHQSCVSHMSYNFCMVQWEDGNVLQENKKNFGKGRKLGFSLTCKNYTSFIIYFSIDCLMSLNTLGNNAQLPQLAWPPYIE